MYSPYPPPYPPMPTPPQASWWNRRSQVEHFLIIVGCGVMLALAIIVATISYVNARATNGGFLYSDATGVIYLNVTSTNNGEVGGTISFDYLSNGSPFHASYDVTGVANGDSMALVIHGVLGTEVGVHTQRVFGGIQASIPDSQGVPQTYLMHPASDADYQTAVSNWASGIGPSGGYVPQQEAAYV